MSDYDDLLAMGYGGPDGIDRLIEDCTKCTSRCRYWDEYISFDDCDECITFWEEED
jgi:hypothetical protein